MTICNRTRRRRFLAACAALVAALALTACATREPATPRADGGDVRWSAAVAWQGDAAIERIRAGRPDRTDPKLQLVGVDQTGNVIRVRFDDETPSSDVVYRHRAGLTGLAIGDVDPSFPGEEIYVGGHASGTGGQGAEGEGVGGAVVQIVFGATEVEVRRIYAGNDYVHAIEPVKPAKPGDPMRLLVTNYAGELHLLTPTTKAGPWQDRLIYRDAPASDREVLKIKDVALLHDAAGSAPHVAMVAMKTGRVIVVDLDHPADARLVHEEAGGLSRVTADDAGGAYLSGYTGRVFHLVKDGDRFRAEAMHHEAKDSGLRGASRGRFPAAGGTATLATWGYFGRCRVLTPRLGAWDATTIYSEATRGHAIEAADLVPGNDADEIALGGYANRIVVLVPRRVR